MPPYPLKSTCLRGSHSHPQFAGAAASKPVRFAQAPPARNALRSGCSQIKLPQSFLIRSITIGRAIRFANPLEAFGNSI